MITIRRANMISRLRPASANTFEYLQRLKLKEQMQQLEPNKETTNPPEQTIMSTEGQPHLDDNSLRKTNGKPPPNLTTFYPYGNPSPLTPGNAEVNIQGVDGVMYKGRMGSYGALRPINPEKDVTGLKVPRPPSPRSGYERGHYNMPGESSPIPPSSESLPSSVLLRPQSEDFPCMFSFCYSLPTKGGFAQPSLQRRGSAFYPTWAGAENGSLNLVPSGGWGRA
uniref:Uncharacterized protein n=1 Tax=Monodelphis domestica TaxID=13616 RepID=K7E487_MONDO